MNTRNAEPDPRALVFASRTGAPMRRSNFRRQAWRLAGHLAWCDAEGPEWTREFTTECEATTLAGGPISLNVAGELPAFPPDPPGEEEGQAA